jgi:hypothetical protein
MPAYKNAVFFLANPGAFLAERHSGARLSDVWQMQAICGLPHLWLVSVIVPGRSADVTVAQYLGHYADVYASVQQITGQRTSKIVWRQALNTCLICSPLNYVPDSLRSQAPGLNVSTTQHLREQWPRLLAT